MKLIVENITKKFDKKTVLNEASMTFESGKIYGLLGRNGSGKTTFFNCINEDLNLDGGEFFLDENNLKRKIDIEDIGYVLSTPEVPEFLTGEEFIKFFLEVNEDKISHPKKIEEYLDMVKLKKEDAHRIMKDYSHGMKSKMQLLANIIASHKILLLDEPLTSFDVVVAEEMKEILKSTKKNKILILSTHIMDLALNLCDEIVILHNGKMEKINAKAKEATEKQILEKLKGEDRE